MPKIIAFVSTRKIPRMAGWPRTKRKPSTIERRLGASASCAAGSFGKSQMLTSEAEKLATSSRYVPVKPSAAITSPPAAGPATALKFDARLSSDDAATIFSSRTIRGSSERRAGVPKLKTAVPAKSST